MYHALADGRRWMIEGTKLFVDAVGGLAAEDYDSPSVLPGWTRRHLVAHVAANADALGNLVHWAATGEQTPMYASAEARAASIERGASMGDGELAAWLRLSFDQLESAMCALSQEQWGVQVVTAQGRAVPATETPWMRAREVCVHAVDLGRGIGFDDLPTDFLEALVMEITAKRSDVPSVDGPLPEVAAWLAGRPHHLTDAPELGPWL